jgi:hypothetical protein
MLTPLPEPGDDEHLVVFLCDLAAWAWAAHARGWRDPVEKAERFILGDELLDYGPLVVDDDSVECSCPDCVLVDFGPN